MTIGKLISIEGTEGAGKSTAMRIIQDYLEDQFIPVIITREPGGTALAEAIRQFLLYPPTEELVTTEAELLLMFASRAQHINHCIKPALLSGKWVVSDRYIDASYAYQGGGRRINKSFIQFLDKWIVHDCYPQLTLLMDIPVEMGLQRAEKRGQNKDRIEKEEVDFFIRIRDAYLTRAVENPERIKIIDASQSLAEVKNQLHDALNTFIKRVAT